MSRLSAEQLLQIYFPIVVRSWFVPTQTKAYTMTKLHCSSFPYLNWKIGDDEKPNIRRVIVDYYMQKMVADHKLSFQSYVGENAIGNCHHLELKCNNVILTTSHLNQCEQRPRKAIFRKQLAKSNYLSLFPDYDEIEKDDKSLSYYAVLCHESKGDKLERAFLGIPSNEKTEKWLATIDLLKEPWQTYHPVVPEEEIAEEELVALRADLFGKKEGNGQ